MLTGSHHLQLREAITQSLAGRTGVLHLHPLSIAELEAAGIRHDHFESSLQQGLLPRVHTQQQRPYTAYANYYQTYIERDVRQLIQFKDVILFEKFIKLLAGRVGQVINDQSLANDAGVDGKAIKLWLSILEASYVVFPLPQYFENFGKRVIKSPKYYFTDAGLLCYLLGIEQEAQITRDPLMGSMFENLVVLDLYSRQVIGWEMGDKNNAKLVQDALTMAVWRRGKVRYVIVHSDQGSTYASGDYRQQLKANDLICSVSRKGECLDNAVSESFVGTLKAELVEYEDYLTKQDAKQSIFEYIEVFYNRRKRHSYLGYISPAEFEEKHAPQ